MNYPNLAQRLAPGADNPTAIGRKLAREAAIQDAFRVLAKRFLLSIPDLTDAERQYLYDLGRDEARYRHRNIQKLIDLSNRSTSASDRQSFGELVRAATYGDVPVPDVAEAIDGEIEAIADATVKLREFERNPCEATRAAAIDAERHLLDSDRVTLDAIEHASVGR